MNDDQAYRIRIIQYLLSKDDLIHEDIAELKRRLKKHDDADDYFDVWLALIRLECWHEFSSDIWKLIK